MANSNNFVLASQFNRPTVMKRIISLSPLARIFQPYVNIEPFLENPALIYDDAYNEANPFSIYIQGAHQTRMYAPGEIHLVDESLTMIYAGIDNTRLNKEYNGTGFVFFEVNDKIAAALDFNKKTGYALPPDLKRELDNSLDGFRQLSHQRCLKAAKDLYNSMVAGRHQLKEAGKEPPEPNDMELLIAYLLKDEVKKAKARRAKLTEAWEAAHDEINADVNALL